MLKNHFHLSSKQQDLIYQAVLLFSLGLSFPFRKMDTRTHTACGGENILGCVPKP